MVECRTANHCVCNNMDSSPNTPTSQELLERIMRLEQENTALKAELTDLGKAFDDHLDGNANDFVGLYDLVIPVVSKVFPNFLPMREKLAAIVPETYANPSVDRRPKDYKRS